MFFQQDTCKIHSNKAISKYFDGTERNPPEFLNKNGNTNVPMNPNEGLVQIQSFSLVTC